jgi:hypothetical protein
MRRFRVTLAGLMAVVIPIAIGSAALRSQSQLWAGIVFCLTGGTLLFATYRATCTGGAARFWWLGFATFGWGSLAAGLAVMSLNPASCDPWDPVGRMIYMQIGGRRFLLFVSDGSAAAEKRWTALLFILHCLVSLLLSFLGAVIFSVFTRRKFRREGQDCEGPPSSA